MPKHKIVVRYTDARMVKGYTANFSPEAPYFLLTPAGAGAAAEPVTVDMNTLKAVFFVRDFAGNPDRPDQGRLPGSRPYQGSEVRVEFTDGEVMVGSTPSYAPEKQGFFLFPADTDANTLKVFALNAAVASVQKLRQERRADPVRPPQGARPEVIQIGTRRPAPRRTSSQPRKPYF